jgi:hypothetical protein
MQVVALWQNYASCPELEELGTITRDAAKDWRDVLLEFQLKVDKKYGTNLYMGGSGNWRKDAVKKFMWVKEKEDVAELRRKLHTGSETIMMLVITGMRYAAVNLREGVVTDWGSANRTSWTTLYRPSEFRRSIRCYRIRSRELTNKSLGSKH